MEISPNYYAPGEAVERYVLMGHNLELIPSDAIGLYARLNNAPLEYINTTDPEAIMDIEVRTDTTISVRPRLVSSHTINNYLGAIVSADRQTVYWVNDTEPLP